MPGYRRLTRPLIVLLAAFAMLSALLSVTPARAADLQSLAAGASLSVGSRLVSPNGQYSAELYDGDLIIWRTGFGQTWRSTADDDAAPGTALVLSGTGRLTLRTADGYSRWSSKTSGFTPSGLQLSDEGNLTILDQSGDIAWESGTSTPTDSATRLPSGAAIISADGTSRAVMQEDGNLVVYRDGAVAWASGTTSPGARALVTPGVGFAILSVSNRILFSTAVRTDKGSTIFISDDGQLALYTSTGLLRWASSGSSAGPVPTTLDCTQVKGPVAISDTTLVNGIRVHKCLAARTKAMIAAAATAGITLSGGGWRDYDRQIELRIQNCGGDDYYSIYEKPSSQCTPPTAIPGRSMHERGLAIDFSTNGRTITRTDPQFAWLSANAAGYGFYNLPSENWHWSTNGN